MLLLKRLQSGLQPPGQDLAERDKHVGQCVPFFLFHPFGDSVIADVRAGQPRQPLLASRRQIARCDVSPRSTATLDHGVSYILQGQLPYRDVRSAPLRRSHEAWDDPSLEALGLLQRMIPCMFLESNPLLQELEAMPRQHTTTTALFVRVEPDRPLRGERRPGFDD